MKTVKELVFLSQNTSVTSAIEHAESNSVCDDVIEDFVKEVSGLLRIPQQYQAAVYEKSYRKGHSDGFYGIYSALIEFVEIFTPTANTNTEYKALDCLSCLYDLYESERSINQVNNVKGSPIHIDTMIINYTGYCDKFVLLHFYFKIGRYVIRLNNNTLRLDEIKRYPKEWIIENPVDMMKQIIELISDIEVNYVSKEGE